MATENKKGSQRKKRSKTTKHIPPECVFCGALDDCEELLGKQIQSCGITVHYFCMLLSSGLCQRGRTDKDGILGFMPDDISAEVARGKKLTCTFCKKKGATIGCTTKACRASFHLKCGRKNGSLHQFFGNFGSFCPTHRPRQAALTSDRLAFFGTANTTCAICMCTVEARASNETLRSPCCRSSWFHRDCIQRLASTAGLHFFKCPLCNNKDVFQEEMLEFGIHIPDQDAAWEMVPNAYQELLERYSKCDAQNCLCKKGREYNKEDSQWEILLCVCCGSQGCHVKCQGLPTADHDWMCPGCEEISEKVSKAKKTKNRNSKKGANSAVSLKEELKKDYEKLQAKACGSRPDCKPVHKQDVSAYTSPGPSGLTSPAGTSGWTRQTPVVKNYPETVVRITARSDDSDIDVNVTSSDDERLSELRSRKSKCRAKRRLQGSPRGSQPGPRGPPPVPLISPDKPFPMGQLKVRVRPCNVQPGTSVSVHKLADPDLKPTGKRKVTPSRHKGSRPLKKPHCDASGRRDADGDGPVQGWSSKSSATSSPSSSISANGPYVLSPQVICRIKAPKVLRPQLIEVVDDSEVSCDEEVSFRGAGSQPRSRSRDYSSCSSLTESAADSAADSVSGSVADSAADSVSTLRPLRQGKRPDYKESKRYRRRLSRETMRSAEVEEAMSLLEGELELSTPQQVPYVSSTVAGDPSKPVLDLTARSSPLSARREKSQLHEPVYIDLETSETDSQGDVVSVGGTEGEEEEVHMISSASDEEEEQEVVFVKAEKFYSSHQYKGNSRLWMTAHRLSHCNRSPGPVGSLTGHAGGLPTVCAQTNAGQILMRTPVDQVAMPLHIGDVALGTSHLGTTPDSHSTSNRHSSTGKGTTAVSTYTTGSLPSSFGKGTTAEGTSGSMLLSTGKSTISVGTYTIGNLASSVGKGTTAVGTSTTGNLPLSARKSTTEVGASTTGNLASSMGKGTTAVGTSTTGNLPLSARKSTTEVGTFTASSGTKTMSSRPVTSTRSQLSSVIIDLTDTPLKDDAPNPEPPSYPSPFRSAQENSSPVRPATTNSTTPRFDKAVSPLKIHKGTLESIRSAVTVNKTQISSDKPSCVLDASVIDLSDVDVLPIDVQTPTPKASVAQRVNKLSLKRNRQRDALS